MQRTAVCLLLLLVFVAVAAQLKNRNLSSPCPQKCLCSAQSVRCMLLHLDNIPRVAPNTSLLDLRFNKIREIPPGTFKGLRQLHTLLLNNNQIRHLKNGSFAGLTRLRYLYLYKNHIEYLDSGVFQGLPRLEQLYLHYNELKMIDAGTFSNMHSLNRLFLHNNKIQHIPPDTFSGMPSLRRLRLDSNALVCDCRMYWLAKMLNNTTVHATANCQYPQSMSGKPLKGMSANDFHCKFPEITEGPKDIEVSWGGTAIFKCRVASTLKAEVIWMRDSLTLPPRGDRYRIMDDGSLKIENSQDADIGQYECLVKTTDGEIKSRPARMIVTKPDTGKPWFVATPEDQVTDLGAHEVRLKCIASGEPQPTISWSQNGIQLALSARHIQESDGTLVIRNVEASDYGIYRCEAANYLGRISSNAQVKINSPPFFSVHPENLEIKIGAQATLLCAAQGSPNPTLSWYRSERPITAGPRIDLNADNTRLTISDAKESDSGLYVCQARNTQGSREISAEIIVKRFAENPPTFIYQPYNIIALPGSLIELPCRARGDPEPDITWRKDGSRLDPFNRKYRISGSGSLYISDVTEEELGRYECIASNEFGRINGNGLVSMKQEQRNEGRISDHLIRIAFSEASREVDSAINETVNSLFGGNSGPPSSGDLFRLIRFPNAPTRELARAAEIYERTLVNIRKHINAGRKGTPKITDFEYRELLSSSHLELITQLSGCMAHRRSSNCTDMCYHSKYRSITGICNNLQNPTWGASLTTFRRILKPIYENGFSMPVGWTKDKLYYGYAKPQSRLISTTLISTEEITPDTEITHMVMQWGQFLDHDLDHAIPSVSSQSWDGIDCKKSCEYAAPCYPIDVPPNDPRIRNRRCIDFFRSSAICGSGMTSVFFEQIQAREQINQLTSFIDASQVYGFSDELAEDLRDLTTNRGRLREGVHFPGRKSLLPYAGSQGMDCRRDFTESNVNCFLAGDVRANEQAGLLSMHTIWMREHNRIADELRRINPQWDGDRLYHETRKVVGAITQHITYSHWLPLVLGGEGMKMLGPYQGYDPTVNPSISNVFATAALRFGHSLINPVLHRLNSSFLPIPEGHLPLHKAFFSPWRIVEEGGVDPLLRGLFTVPAKLKTPEQNLNTELTEHLFKVAHAVALDLAAINIQRSRDHALPGYLEYRQFCNLSRVESFDDLKHEIRSYEVRRKLQTVYGHPGNVDVWVGGILEDQVEGGRVGPLFRCLLAEQFKRLRDGDRFWYENPSVFKPEQITQIKQTSLGRVICDNGDSINDITKNVFILENKQGGFISCDKIPKMDLRMWAQCCDECNNRPGQFNSLSRLNRRSRRDAEYSYPNDKPVYYNSTENAVLDEITENRLEGIEELFTNLQKEMRQMRRDFAKLKNKLPLGYCLESTGKRWKDGQKWSLDKCTNCSCKGDHITCTKIKCPTLDCETYEIHPKECCPVCKI